MEKPNYFYTQNAQLAFALVSAGATLLGQPDGPCQNVYSLPLLRQLKATSGAAVYRALDGKTLEAGALEAFNRGLPGHVTYFFVRNELLELAIAAWDAMANEFQLAKAQQRPPIVPAVDPVKVMQSAYIMAQNRGDFARLPFFNRPMVTTVEAQKTGEGDTVSYSGCGSTWTVGASDHLRSRIKA